MGTPFTEIFDLFMTMQTDYRLISLFTASPENFTTYLTGWLKPAVVKFENVCDQDLTYNLTTKTFNSVLSNKNVTTLAEIVKLYWMNKEIDDVSQMNMILFDKDFKRYAESQNYKTKQDRLILINEEVSKILVSYSLDEQSTWDFLKAING